jgi:two-component sensor histidine kinase
LLAQQRQLDEATNRNLLVREVHHRIKNNLQGVIGLLHRFTQKNPELSDVMRQAIGQVRTISVIHGLQGSSITSAVLLCDLTRSIAHAIQQLWQTPVMLNPESQWPRCTLVSDEAVPIALVLNELLTNAVKHGGQGSVSVSMVAVAETGGASISICNTGLFPLERRHPGASHSGLDLVSALMPRHGARLVREQQGDQVVTRLELDPPVLAAELKVFL